MMKKITLSLAVSLGLGFVSSVYAETTEEKVQRLEAELNALADTVEKGSSGASTPSRTKLGGYGELHYNDIDGKDAKIDFHRFVLLIGHEFNDKVRMFSEFELEHSIAGEGKNGEVELEQAYIEMDINAKHAAKAGLFLMPVGIINETH